MYLRAALVAIALLGGVVGGCGTDDAEQACNDVADAVESAAERCMPGSGAANRAAFVDALGGCGNVDKVRDHDSLYGTCIPSLETISCEDLMSGTLDPTCMSQLQIVR